MLAVDKIGMGSGFRIMTESGFQTSVSACVKAFNILLLNHIKIAFVCFTVFNISYIE
jgi:hypothetical protein